MLIECAVSCGRAVLEGSLHEVRPALCAMDLDAFFASELGRAAWRAGLGAIEMLERARREQV